MKKRIHKLLALILVVASLVSVFAIFPSAEGEQQVEEQPAIKTDDLDLFYNRSFDEGWDVNNGMSVSKGKHTVKIDYEENADSTYNYFLRYELVNDMAEIKTEIDTKNNFAKDGMTILSFRIMADDASDVGNIVSVKTDNNPSKTTWPLLNITSEGISIFSGNLIAPISNQWQTISFAFNWDYNRSPGNPDTEDTWLYCQAYLNGEPIEGGVLIAQYGDQAGNKGGGVDRVIFGCEKAASTAKAAERDGKGFCIDDIQLYQCEKKNFLTGPIDLSKLPYSETAKYGVRVDSLAPKTIDIYEGTFDKTAEQVLTESLCMKVGVTTALLKDKKVDISKYVAPTVVDGKVMIPIQAILDFIGFPIYAHPDGLSFDITTGTSATYLTAGRASATVDGKLVALTAAPGFVKNGAGDDVLVIALEDIPAIFPGWAVTYDSMGLIIMHEQIFEGEELVPVVTREKDLELMLRLMKKFIFGTVESDNSGNALGDDAAYTATGEKVYADVKAATNSFTHPYLYTNQAGFDKLRSEYMTENVTVLDSYIGKMLEKADAIYADVAIDNDGTYVGIAAGKEPVNLYDDGVFPDAGDENSTVVKDSDDGYHEETNDLYAIEEYSEKLVYLALAYQITRNEKYALLAYDYTMAFNNWRHWGPGYIINCATAVKNISVSYDWLYNAYAELGKDVSAVAEMIYDKGLYHGYLSAAGEFCKFPRTEGYGDVYSSRMDSWNAIGTSGMVIGSLAVMEFIENADEKYAEYGNHINYLVGSSLINLSRSGLDWYAPDGSYIESTTYWAKATNSLMNLIMALDSAAGTDYGYMGASGLDTTFYFALYMEDSDGFDWNYHEDGFGSLEGAELSGVDTQIFNFAGLKLNDEKLIAIRQQQIANGKKEVSIYDVLFYHEGELTADTTLELDYYMEAIDAFVSRSDWESGALYTGMMGGANAYSPYTSDDASNESFGQIDSGNFIYRNKGIDWIQDLGSDSFKTAGYFANDRYKIYRNAGEGNNVLLLTSKQNYLPYGQDTAGNGTMIQNFSDPNGTGGYAIIDNLSAYGDFATLAQRGILVTNDRKTVIVQDQVIFKEFQEVMWVAHTAEKITISADGKTAYLTHINEDQSSTVLRATLVSSGAYKFSSDRYKDNKGDERWTQILMSGTKEGTYPRENMSRLLIKSGSTIGFSAAVVFELVAFEGSSEEVNYTWTELEDWGKLFGDGEIEDTTGLRGPAVRNDISSETMKAGLFVDEEEALTSKFADFYRALTNVAYTLKTFDPNTFIVDNPALADAYDDYVDYADMYDEYREYMNNSVDQVHSSTAYLRGIGR